MKTWSTALLVSLWAGAGCVGLPLLTTELSFAPAPTVVEPAPPSVNPTGPVSADQITPANARAMARALEEELDREQRAGAAEVPE